MTGMKLKKKYSVMESLSKIDKKPPTKALMTRIKNGLTAREWRELKSILYQRQKASTDAYRLSAYCDPESSGRIPRNRSFSGGRTETVLKGLLDLLPAFKISDRMSIMVSIIEKEGGNKWVDIRKWYSRDLKDGSSRVTPGKASLQIELQNLPGILNALNTLASKWLRNSPKH
jgi:hypothetical protein